MRIIQLFRALFPSWRFFDEVGQVPRLYYRISFNEDDLSPWRNSLEKSERRVSSLFLNSEGNYLAACHSLLQQVIDDLEEWPDPHFEESTSYQLAKNLALFQILKSPGGAKWFRYQFKVAADEDILISPVYVHGEAV